MKSVRYPAGKFPPKIEGAEDTLRKHLYGARTRAVRRSAARRRSRIGLDIELNSIINNGYAVMYVSAQMLVNKSSVGRLSGRLPRLGWLILCCNDGGNHGGKSARPALSVSKLQEDHLGRYAEVRLRRRYAADGLPGLRHADEAGRLHDSVRDLPRVQREQRAAISTLTSRANTSRRRTDTSATDFR